MSGAGWRTLDAEAAESGGGEAAGVLIADDLGRVCLQLRDDFPHVRGAGLWALFGGHREPGESLAEAAVREMAEETGLAFTTAELTPFARTRVGDGPCIHLFATARRFRPADIRVGEGAGFAFFTREQIAGLAMVESSRRLLAAWLAAA